MRVNVWVALRDDAQAAINERLTWDVESQGPYTGPVSNRTAILFTRMFDRAVVERLFRVATIGGRQYTLWNLYFTERGNILQLVQDELDQLALDYPNQFIIAGAWIWDDNTLACRQVGTQLDIQQRTYQAPTRQENPNYQPDDQLPNFDPEEFIFVDENFEEVYVAGHTGTPTYPIHPQLIELMPDVDDQGTRPTNLSDVNLVAGQPPREFS
jgi:hypothetical protein